MKSQLFNLMIVSEPDRQRLARFTIDTAFALSRSVTSDTPFLCALDVESGRQKARQEALKATGDGTEDSH